LGGRKGIWPVKTEWWGAGVVICLERGADLHIGAGRILKVDGHSGGSNYFGAKRGKIFLVPPTF